MTTTAPHTTTLPIEALRAGANLYFEGVVHQVTYADTIDGMVRLVLRRENTSRTFDVVEPRGLRVHQVLNYAIA